MEYGGLSFNEALDLPCDQFALLRKHGFIARLLKSEEGREYLEKCERMNLTEPDFGSLRRMPGYTGRKVDG